MKTTGVILVVSALLSLALSTATQAASYPHGDFETLAIRSLSAGLPVGWRVKPAQVPGVQAFVDRYGPAIRMNLCRLFECRFGSLEEPGDELWLEGEALRAYLAPLRSWGGEGIEPLIDSAAGFRLVRNTHDATATFYFDRAVTVQLKSRASAKTGEVYAIAVPRLISFRVAITDGVLSVRGLDQGADPLRFRVMIPVISDNVYLRNVTVDLTDGRLWAEAGVVGNQLIVIARAQLMAKRFDGVDWMNSLVANLGAIFSDPLVFSLE